MTDGLILLAFLAVIFAVLVVRFRRRMGLGSTAKTWSTVITGFILIALALYAASIKG
jgi:hypothetical protein